MAEITVSRMRLQIDAVELEHVKCISDIAARGLHVRQRHETHGAVARRMVGDDLRHGLIAGLDQMFGEVDIAEIGAG